MNLLHDIAWGKNAQTINVIIEINKGSKNKYEIDKETGIIALDRVLHTAQDYPFDYGFVPQTHWYDGDALDVVLLTTHALFPGCLVEARPVAVVHMIDGGDKDEKIIAVPVGDPRFDTVRELSDINPHTLKEIEHFFLTYKLVQNKVVEITSTEGREAAEAAVLESVELYKQKHN
jgi:inorganic pyrophosphatase